MSVLWGQHKLADKWDKDSYVVIDIPDKSIPLYKVQKDSGDHSVKTLHRNMLLPFSAIPGLSEVGVPDTTQESLPKLHKTRSKTPKCSAELPDSESNSDSYDSAIPRYIIPARRNNVRNLNGQSSGSASGSTISVSNDASQNVSNGNTDSIVTPVAVDEIQFSVGSVSNSQTEQSGSSTQVGSTLSSSSQSDQLGTSAVGSS